LEFQEFVAEICGETSFLTKDGPSPMSAEESNETPSSDMRRTDGSLLRRIHSGEQDAAAALYLRYAERLHALTRSKTSSALAARLDPEDVVQSVFRTFFRRASEGHYDIPDGDELWKLLLVISLNKIRTLAGYHRAAKRDVRATVAIPPEAAAPGSSEEESLKILEMVIEETLSDLPEAQREMIRLRIEGHGVAEIAKKTQRSKRSVERVLQQFRSRLGRLVLEEPPDHDPSA
jgi:RNA polymerase sigma-70 factor (ECF subfamily)